MSAGTSKPTLTKAEYAIIQRWLLWQLSTGMRALTTSEEAIAFGAENTVAKNASYWRGFNGAVRMLLHRAGYQP